MTTGLLGDTRARAYARKLELFNSFAEPELRGIIAGLGVPPGGRALDAGCGTGHVSAWLAEAASPGGLVIGLDLAEAHAAIARGRHAHIAVADAAQPPLQAGAFDLIWSSNTVNHMRDPVVCLRGWRELLRPGGRIVLGQSTFLPEMFFAWDARLEEAVTAACRRYYRDKYRLDERDLTATRNLLGVAQRAGLRVTGAHTIAIERTAPLAARDTAYFVECVFQGTWGERVRPYLSASDWAGLQALCDPSSPAFCLARSDFHHVQTYTVVCASL
jgi:SAM-dependent methyltransferase